MKARDFPYWRTAAFLAAGIVLAACVHVASFLLRAPSGPRAFKEILIPSGSSYRTVATQLADAGVITDKEMFVLLGRVMGVDKKIRAGFYSLNTNMRPLQVLRIIGSGKIIEYQVVLPEGHTIIRAAEILDASGLVSKDEFLALATDKDYVRSLGLDADSLEGYLFPATYYFPKGITADGIIRRLVSKYRDVFNDDLRERAEELGMTEHQVVTLASLIEREAMLDSERMLISAVFHNRLRRGMRLQCDPTIIYALQLKGKWNGDITRADLRMKDPYNTYINPGLPPGPIASPGKPSIIAALYPADVDYIFFVSRGDGSHFFSSNLAEHNRAVQEYQVEAALRAEARAKAAAEAEKQASAAATQPVIPAEKPLQPAPSAVYQQPLPTGKQTQPQTTPARPLTTTAPKDTPAQKQPSTAAPVPPPKH